MSTLLSAFHFQVGAQVKGLETDLARAERITKSRTRRMAAQFSALAKRAAAVGVAVGAGFALASKRALERADQMAKAADKIGISTTALQEYRHAAELAGVEQKTLDMALQRFSRRVGEVAQGTGELQKVAEKYNVAMRDQEGRMRSNSELMREFADVIANAESEQEQLRIAFKLFDSEGAAVVNMLKNGSGALDAMTREAHELGLVMDEDMIRKSEEANDRLGILQRQVSMQFNVALLENMDTLVRWAERLAAAVRFTLEMATALDKASDALLRFLNPERVRQIADTEEELRGLREQIDAIRGGDATARFELEATGGSLADLEERAAGLEEKLKILREEFPEAAAAADEMADELKRLGERTDRTSKATGGLIANTEEAKKEAEAFTKQLEAYGEQLVSVSEDYEELAQAVDPARAAAAKFFEAQERVNRILESGRPVTNEMERAAVNLAFGLEATATQAEFVNTVMADLGVPQEVLDTWHQLLDTMSRMAGLGPALSRVGPPQAGGGEGGGAASDRAMEQFRGMAMQEAQNAAINAITGGEGLSDLGQLYTQAANVFFGPIVGFFASLQAAFFDDLFGSSNPGIPTFNIQAQQPSFSGLDQSRQTPFGGVSTGTVWNLDQAQIERILDQLVNFDRQLAMIFDPSDFEAITSALAGFNETFEASGATAEEVMRRRFIAALNAAEPEIAAFVETFGDLNSMLRAFEGIETIRGQIADMDNVMLALSDSLDDNITAQLNRMDTALGESRTAFDQALHSMDPAAIADAGREVQRQLIQRYELEKRLIEDIQNQLQGLAISGRDFRAEIAGAIGDITGDFTELAQVTAANLAGARGDVLAAGGPQDIMSAARRFADRVSAWLDAATQRIQSQIAALETEAQQIIAAGQERAQAAAERSRQIQSAMEQARQAEISALQRQVEQAREWMGVLQSSQRFLDQLTFGGQNPLTAFQRLAEVNRQIGAIGQPAGAGEAQRLIELIQERMALAGDVFQRPSPEFRRVFNESARQIEALRDQAKSQEEIANQLQEQANALQQQTVGVIGAGNSQAVILSTSEQARLDAIREEQEELRAEQEAVNQQAVDHFRWVQDVFEAAEQERQRELLDALDQITGNLDPDSHLAQLQQDTRDGVWAIADRLEQFLEEIRNFSGMGGSDGFTPGLPRDRDGSPSDPDAGLKPGGEVSGTKVEFHFHGAVAGDKAFMALIDKGASHFKRKIGTA